eukprot:1159867-Pelagomonas_calceolata.AAC.9
MTAIYLPPRVSRNHRKVCKYKGLKNKHTMVRPFVTEGGDFVMCGSDDGAVYIWDRLLQCCGVAFLGSRPGSWKLRHAMHGDLSP